MPQAIMSLAFILLTARSFRRSIGNHRPRNKPTTKLQKYSTFRNVDTVVMRICEALQVSVGWLPVHVNLGAAPHYYDTRVLYRVPSPATTAQLVKIASVSPTFVFLIRIVVCKAIVVI